jgi:excisionase family DNA binding protein
MSEGSRKKEEYIPVDPGLTVDQVAKELGAKRNSVRRMIVDGAIPHYIVRAGKRKKMFRVRRSVLMRWIEAQERASVKGRNRAPAVNLAVVSGDQGPW